MFKLPVLPTLPTLPDMQCDAGCRECCNEPVPVSDDELLRVVLYANEHDIVPSEDTSMCPWFQDGRCAVYEARPIVCRVFGHVEELNCPRGYNTNVDPALVIPAMSVKGKGEPVRFLHEVIENKAWMDRVEPAVWEGVARARKRAGLEPLEGR